MKRKVKRFNEGGYESTDDYKNLMSAADREGVEYTGGEFAKTLPAEPMKMASFGEAFKEARGRGDKTFEYMGKKYTTEMAKPKAAPKAEAPKAEAPKAETSKPRTLAQKQEAAAPKMQSAYRGAADNFKRGLKSMFGMKSGGKVSSASKRADGCATKGKTRGRVI